MQSGWARTHEWAVEFIPSHGRHADPLMGWSGGGDTQTQVKLFFDTRDEAIAYAERAGIQYDVELPQTRRSSQRPTPTTSSGAGSKTGRIDRAVLMAVYTEVTDEALADFLLDYDIGTMVAFRGIAEGVENSNFSLRTSGGDFILTLYEKRVDPNDLPWFLGLMEHLAQHGLVCPQPVRGRDGAALRHLSGKHAAITTFLPGVWPRRVRQGHCGPVGAALAKLHVAGVRYVPTRANALGPESWMPLLDRCRARGDEVQVG